MQIDTTDIADVRKILQYCCFCKTCYVVFNFNLIYLFMSRHEVHSMNTHTLQNAGRWKQTKQNVVQGIDAGGITALQTLFVLCPSATRYFTSKKLLSTWRQPNRKQAIQSAKGWTCSLRHFTTFFQLENMWKTCPKFKWKITLNLLDWWNLMAAKMLEHAKMWIVTCTWEEKAFTATHFLRTIAKKHLETLCSF